MSIFSEEDVFAPICFLFLATLPTSFLEQLGILGNLTVLVNLASFLRPVSIEYYLIFLLIFLSLKFNDISSYDFLLSINSIILPLVKATVTSYETLLNVIENYNIKFIDMNMCGNIFSGPLRKIFFTV